MRFFLLGPVRASANGVDLRLGGAKERTVLAALLFNTDHVLGNDRLTHLLWDTTPPETATAQIHTYMSRLRIKLSPHVKIVHQHHGYRMELCDAWVDYKQFTMLSALGHSELAAGNYHLAAQHFRAALALWRGPVVEDATPYLAERVGPGWEEQRLAALDGRINADLYLGLHARLVPELTDLVGEYPYREELRAHLMKALYFSNRRTDALAAFQDARRTLVEEVGVDPSEALAHTHMAVLQGRGRRHLLQLATP